MGGYLFSGLIKCGRCGKNYKGKKYRKNKVYICSGYSNYGKEFCSISGKVNEDDLLFLIGDHDIRNIREIIIDENVYVKVIMDNNSELIWDSSKIIRY